MKKHFILFSTLSAIILILATCTKENVKVINQSPQLPDTYYDYPAIFNSGNNSTTDAGATLGRVLFYDKKLSLNNTVSCGTCHQQQKAFSDGKQLSEGFEGRITRRNAPGLINLHQMSRFFWDGRTETLEELALQPVENHIEMGMENMDDLATKLTAYDYYPPLFQDAFGTSDINPELISKAIAQFLRSMVSHEAKIDQIESTEELTGLERLGHELFFSWERGGCVNCHSGNNFSGWGTNFSNIGLDESYADNGLGELRRDADGRFKVPSLRNVALTAPYMHDGRFETLEEVVEHYSNGVQAHPNLDWSLRNGSLNDVFFGGDIIIVPSNGIPNETGNPDAPIRRNFSDTEKRALVAFLHTLTDKQFITDPKYADPFDY